MKRSKNQAVYKFLPETWVSERNESNVAVTAKIIKWNYDKMQDIYDDFIENEIKRQIELFGKRGGDITSFDLRDDVHSFCIVEPKCLEGIPDIFGEMSPLVFYCSSCGHVIEKHYASDVDRYVWNCTNPDCKKRHSVKQLQMIYACECGFAQGVRIPFLKGHHDFKYHPNENQFKLFYKSGNSEKSIDIAMMCPTCNSRLLPDNANAGRNYKAFTLCIINLVDARSGEFYKKGEEAKKAIIAKWFGKMSQAEYETILDNVAEAFSERLRTSTQRKAIEDKYNAWIEQGIIPRELADTLMQQEILTLQTNSLSIERYAKACDIIFAGFRNMNSVVYREWLNNFSFKLMQYNTIKYARRTITLEDSINRQMEMDFIESAQDVYRLHKKLGIANMQVSSDIQIVNCTYGYSRRAFDPKKSMNKNCRLKLNAWLIHLQQIEKKSYSSIHSIRGVLRPAFQLAVDDDLIRKNPFQFQLMEVVVNDSVTREAISRAEERKFLRFVKEDPHFCRYYEGIYILFKTGLRISEFCGLTISDIDFKEHTINIDHQLQKKSKIGYYIQETKTTSGTRKIPMTADVEECFRKIIEKRNPPKAEPMVDGKSGFLYFDKNESICYSLHWEHYFQHIIQKYNNTYKVQMPVITPHVCRHTYCSNMAKSGMNPKALQYLMGHSDISVTLNTYTHVNLEDAREEVARIQVV